MKFHTNLSPTECLKRLKKPIENSPDDMKKAIRRQYGSYFSKTPDKFGRRMGRWDFQVYEVSIWYRRIYTDVDTDKFEVSVANWDKRSVPVVNGDKRSAPVVRCDKRSNRYSNRYGNGSQTKYSGTIVENEDGGSTVEFHITRCEMCFGLYFFIAVVLVGIIVIVVDAIVEHRPDYYSGIAKMGLMDLFLLLGLFSPVFITEAKSRRLVVEFIKDLLEISDINKQQVIGRLRKMPKQE